MQYTRNWVRADGVPASFTVDLTETLVDPSWVDPGPVITLPDQVGWWFMSSYGGVLPPKVQKDVDKILAAAPTVTTTSTVPARTPWGQPTTLVAEVPAPDNAAYRSLSTLLINAARTADDPEFDGVVQALVDEYDAHHEVEETP